MYSTYKLQLQNFLLILIWCFGDHFHTLPTNWCGRIKQDQFACQELMSIPSHGLSKISTSCWFVDVWRRVMTSLLSFSQINCHLTSICSVHLWNIGLEPSCRSHWYFQHEDYIWILLRRIQNCDKRPFNQWSQSKHRTWFDILCLYKILKCNLYFFTF